MEKVRLFALSLITLYFMPSYLCRGVYLRDKLQLFWVVCEDTAVLGSKEKADVQSSHRIHRNVKSDWVHMSDTICNVWTTWSVWSEARAGLWVHLLHCLERWYKWLWTWHGWWCQMGLSEFLRNCWSSGIFWRHHTSLGFTKNSHPSKREKKRISSEW